MIKKSILRSLMVVMLTATVVTGGWIIPTDAASIEVESTNTDKRAAVLSWYYKTENGKTYRRLYDETNEKWLTDWILCE